MHISKEEAQLGDDFLSLQKLFAAVLLQKKLIMQVLAANILMRISIVKIVWECFLPWQESQCKSKERAKDISAMSHFVLAIFCWS